jgi:Anti-sigma factor NepR
MSTDKNRMQSVPSASGAAPETPPPPLAAPTAARRNSRYAQDPVSLGLRKLWHELENEPVPAEFLDLLDAIDAARTNTVPPKSDDPTPLKPGDA